MEFQKIQRFIESHYHESRVVSIRNDTPGRENRNAKEVVPGRIPGCRIDGVRILYAILDIELPVIAGSGTGGLGY